MRLPDIHLQAPGYLSGAVIEFATTRACHNIQTGNSAAVRTSTQIPIPHYAAAAFILPPTLSLCHDGAEIISRRHLRATTLSHFCLIESDTDYPAGRGTGHKLSLYLRLFHMPCHLGTQHDPRASLCDYAVVQANKGHFSVVPSLSGRARLKCCRT